MRGIIVFVKNPELGKVKTRLADTLGDAKALEIYNKLIGYTRDVLLDIEHEKKYIYYSSFVDLEDDWSNEVFEKRLQSCGGLGTKIISAVRDTFEDCDQIIIIGSDCPELTSAHIGEAFFKLEANNIVIGPSHDGGYYLLGMDKYYPELFQDIPWSTDTVFRDTLQNVKAIGLRYAELEMLSDIDYEEDWVKYGF